MHPTNQSTVNGRFTTLQRIAMEQKIKRYLIYRLRKQKYAINKDKRGIQIKYGMISRKYKISYKQARAILVRLVASLNLKIWHFYDGTSFKTRGNFYSYQKIPKNFNDS